MSRSGTKEHVIHPWDRYQQTDASTCKLQLVSVHHFIDGSLQRLEYILTIMTLVSRMKLLALLVLTVATAQAWVTAPTSAIASRRISSSLLHVTKEKPSTLEDTTEKYGLEVGVLQSLQKKDTDAAKSVLKKYGIADLATSIPLAAVSFAICYLLVDHGVNVGALLEKVGICSGGAEEKAGTFAIAYAAHKAASPIRFPPTVLLTPVVAKLIGKEPEEEAAADEE